MRLAVVGHVEWVDFLVAERLPQAGEILHVRSAHEGPAGGGGMAAYAMRSLTGGCTFFCAVGHDERGRRTEEALAAAGLDVEAAVHAREQRRTVTYLTNDGERTITVLGARLMPLGADALRWGRLGSFDGVFLTLGDADAVRAARQARVLVATPRARDALISSGVAVDALVGSVSDPGEQLDDELVAATQPRLVVRTDGARGGSWRAADGTEGRWDAAPLPGPVADAYGCGDAFASALTAGLAAGWSADEACAMAARVGAALLCERAPAVGDLAPLLTRV